MNAPCLFQLSLRSAAVVVLTMVGMLVPGSESRAATAAQVVIESLQVTPDSLRPGLHPDVAAGIGIADHGRQQETREVCVVAVVTRPDHVLRSWQWKQIVIDAEREEVITLPKEYDTRRTGIYKVEFVVYSADMRRRLHGLSRTFVITDLTDPAGPVVPERDRKSSPMTVIAGGRF